MLAIPDNPNDLYSLPQPVLASLRSYLLRGFPLQFDAPGQVSLFAYDNNSFATESFLDHPAQVTITLPGTGRQIRNLATGQQMTGQAPPPIITPFGRHIPAASESQFHITVQPHSFVAFAAK